MKPYDILAIGELNVDLILNNIDGEPEVGKEKFAGDMILTLGSSTAIFAANAAALGAKVGFVGMIGQDTLGNLIRESLEAKGVDTSMLIETDEHSSGATIVLNYGEDRAMVTYQGAMAVMSFADIDKSVFEKCRHIHISSIFLQPALKSRFGKNTRLRSCTRRDDFARYAMGPDRNLGFRLYPHFTVGFGVFAE